jgi:hypothetical protein
MYQITEQFNPNSVIFHGQSGDKYCQIVVLKKFNYLWMANLYYFFSPPSWEPTIRMDWIWKIEQINQTN